MSERAVTGSPCIIITTEQLVQTAQERGGNWINLTSEFICIWKFTYREPSVSRKGNGGKGKGLGRWQVRGQRKTVLKLSAKHTDTHTQTHT